MKKKKVLILIYSIKRGGIEVAATAFQMGLDRDKFEFIYYLQNSAANEEQLTRRVLDSGAQIIGKPQNIGNYIKEYGFLKQLMRKEQIDIVHAHMLFHSGMVMRAAFKAGVPKRIAHSHATKDNRKTNFLDKIYRRLMRRWLDVYATDKLACSEQAGAYLYGEKSFEKNGVVINNGVDSGLYCFSEEKRELCRNRLKLSDSLVVGHIGSVYWIKNQEFLIRIFSELLKLRDDCVLLLVGEIRDDGKAEQLAEQLGIASKVRFLGVCADIPELLCAMDVFIFPSLFEALPIAPVEAQATKLPCLISDSVSKDTKQNENVEFLPLSEPPHLWAQRALALSQCERAAVSTQKLMEAYDIKTVTRRLENIYEG